MRIVRYRGRPAAVVVDADRVVFDPALEARGCGDPLLRFVAAMCRLAMEIQLGLESGAYDDERAEGYAREALMGGDCFAALAALPDPYLAACFGVPPEQVAARRTEIGLSALCGGGDCRPT
jgi:hypothetical protein